MLFADTMSALLRPRRALPVLALALPLVIAQGSFSRDPLAAPLGIAMVLAFLLVGPFAWRTLFPMEKRPLGTLPVRVVGYVALSAALVYLVGGFAPFALDMGVTFLTDDWSLIIASALFVVGGWGLGRDIELEEAVARAERRTRELESEAEHAQLLAIRTHLDPHFLFNTLNAIAEWCREDGEVAERATLQLSAMLRTVLEGVRGRAWPLERELSLLDTLFELHLFRDPSLFVLVREVDDDLPDVRVPPMVLLPLAENAVKHGPAAGHRGEIRMSVGRVNGALRFVLDNPGPFEGPRDGGEGVAMVDKRLALAYGGRARFEIRKSGERTIAEVILPLDVHEPEVSA